MNKDQIKKILIERGYSRQGAETASSDLMNIDERLKPCLNEWLKSNKEIDFSVCNHSIKELMRSYGYKYPAALLGINWILNDPDTAISVIKKGIR